MSSFYFRILNLPSLPEGKTIKAQITNVLKENHDTLFPLMFSFEEAPRFAYASIVFPFDPEKRCFVNLEGILKLQKEYPEEEGIKSFFQFLENVKTFEEQGIPKIAYLANVKDNYYCLAVSQDLSKKEQVKPKANTVLSRLERLVESGLNHEVIALLMTCSANDSTTYKKEDVQVLYKFFQDVKKGTELITEKQCTALIDDMQESGLDTGDS